MWSYQPAMGLRRSPSSEAGPSVSPKTLTRVSSTYPPDSYDHEHEHGHWHEQNPHTPTNSHRRPLGRVDESPSTSAGSRAPFVARDYADVDSGPYYAASPASMTETHRSSLDRGGGVGMMSDSEMESRTETASIPPDPDPDVARQRLAGVGVDEGGADLVPPVSVHDAYLSKHITPLVPETSARPVVARSTSVPAMQHNADLSGGGLLPPADVQGKANPIFEIFDAAPSEGGRKLEKRLRGHLKDVLKVQEEIGKMHLALEGLGLGSMDTTTMGEEEAGKREMPVGKEEEGESKEDSLSRREKSVDALMEKLGMLSDTLRTYHDLGTPRLQFPSDGKNAPADALSDAVLPSPSPPQMNRQLSAFPSIGGPPTMRTDPPSHISPHPKHRDIEDLIRSEGGGTGSGSKEERTRQSSKNSDLPPLRLLMDDYDRSPGGLRKKPSASFKDLESLRREEREGWHEQPDGGVMSAGSGAGVGRAGGAVERRRFGYALKEPVDRSRAW